MMFTTAIINTKTIVARCVEDQDGCIIWQGSVIQGKPYWATYDQEGKRVNVNVVRIVAEEAGHTIRRGRQIKRTCGKFLCVNAECMHLPKSMGMFSQLIKDGARSSVWR